MYRKIAATGPVEKTDSIFSAAGTVTFLPAMSVISRVSAVSCSALCVGSSVAAFVSEYPVKRLTDITRHISRAKSCLCFFINSLLSFLRITHN